MKRVGQGSVCFCLFLVIVTTFFLWSVPAAWCDDSQPAQSEKAPAKPETQQPAAGEKLRETSHSITIDGRQLDYRAVAGWLPVSVNDGKMKARIFFVSYQLAGAEKPERPVTFAFNGGPGAASLWLHLGALGPKRVVLNEDGTPPPPPAQLEPNPDTWLRFTDLVFVDPVGTGFSRSDPDDMKTRKEFYEVKTDIASMGELIRLYLTRYQRWGSPKLVVGESYGGTRAAGLGEYLLDQFGIELNGLLLISPVLDYNTILFRATNGLPYVLCLPSYAAAARFHGRLSPALEDRRPTDFLHSVEEFSETAYATALLRGDRLSPAEHAELSQKIAGLIGVSKEVVERSDLKIPPDVFRKDLLRDKRLLVGRMDAEITGADLDPATSHAAYDPSLDSLTGVFSGAMNAYLRKDLLVQSDLSYEFLSSEVGSNWDWGASLRGGQGFVEVSRSLRNVMEVSTYLKTFVAAGMYDLATPYAATRYALSHLGLDRKARSRLELHLYEAGHMVYIHKAVRDELARDAADFYQRALQK